MGRIDRKFIYGLMLIVFVSLAYGATDAFYRHHQRSTTTSLEADLVARELGIDASARNSLIAKKADGNLIHVIAKEMDTASLNGVLNVAGQTNLSGAVKMANYTSTRVPYFTTGGLITDASTFTYNGTTLAVNNGTYSGTLSVMGQSTLVGATFNGGTSAQGAIYTVANIGLALQGKTGSLYDFCILGPGGPGSYIMRTTTGTTNADFPGSVSFGGTATTTGVHTFTAAPVFTALTASLPMFTNGSKAATSNAMTGTGSVVMSTSPTLVTPALGAATATSIVASGNVTADSLISSKFYEEGSFTATLTGVTTTVTGTAYFTRIGKHVTLRLPSLIGTSNTTAMTITGMPSQIRPSVSLNIYTNMETRNNGTDNLLSMLTIATSGVISPAFATSVTGFYGTAYASSSTKGVYGATITYTLQ